MTPGKVYQFVLDRDEYETLLLMLGIALGSALKYGEQTRVRRFFAVANKINEQNPDWGVKYVQAAIPIDAIVEHLDETRLPRTEDQIVDALFAGGYKGGHSARPMHEARIRASINVHINGKGAQGKNALKKLNGLIGMASWDDSLFQ